MDEHGPWRLAQTLTNPDGFMVNDAFGAGVAIHGHSAMIGNGSLVQGPHLAAGFGTGVAFGPNGRLAVGSSPFLGFFLPVIFRPPPAVAPPVAPGKVIVYEPAGH